MSGQEFSFASLEELMEEVEVGELQLAAVHLPEDLTEYHDEWQWGDEGDTNMPDDELEREFLQSYSTPPPNYMQANLMQNNAMQSDSMQDLSQAAAGKEKDMLIQYLLSPECTLFISEGTARMLCSI
jgi:hypothetical protein